MAEVITYVVRFGKKSKINDQSTASGVHDTQMKRDAKYTVCYRRSTSDIQGVGRYTAPAVARSDVPAKRQAPTTEFTDRLQCGH